ncbi:LPXTG-motif cell wall anchor domain protein [Beutenbergia cavernae DSM 12333]|uniref:LPXTG-motif cell wall anchor domain protein n=1 Tax=Beutenbergia cavernae (strain ATCC BAA-8 / DSM 12333 / CCUG 43141 / JCM 11478 / NBRC 16432 / NCIMB 13614 / HKI 0122) TaxID=471853 RepID=C5C5Z2_BEUC1|nr:choice-of-anchor A family protein [Beutenbergia cavernae]ACQ82350.1 LPXTG-motif cell wall anchor domain protein [Beutenbergia cavernae DSM 12333]
MRSRTRTAQRTLRRRTWAAFGLGACLAVAGYVPVSAVLSPLAPASADPAPECPGDGEMPNGGSVPIFTDNAVAVYVGGDFHAVPDAAESEGLMVVHGDATFDRPGLFDIGVVGAGSGIVPEPGSTMLAVGGDMTLGGQSSVDVGPLVTGGGAVHVGGAVSGEERLTTNGGGLTQNMGPAALLPYDPTSFPADMVTASTTLAAEAVTGTAVAAAPTLTFTSTDPTATLQVFEVDAADLAGISGLAFDGFPDGASIVVNVTGGPVTGFAPLDIRKDGVRVDAFGFPGFGDFASSLLWNFTGTTTVDIAGSSQFMGSILGPNVDLTTETSTNGRVYVGGDYTMAGTGTEHHNFPWNFAFPCDPTPGATPLGSVEITKDVADGTPFENLHFTGGIRCVTADGAIFTTRWGVTVGAVDLHSSLPIGAECEIFENLAAVTQEVDGELLPVDLAGMEWANPVITVDGVVTSTFTVTDAGQIIELNLANTLLGTFDVTKVVDGPDGGYVGDRDFDVDWTCSADAYVDGDPADPAVSDGTIGVADGVTGGPVAGGGEAWFPVGTTCDLSEDLVEEDGDFADEGFRWDGVTIGPAGVTIGADEASPTAVTVTNTYVSTLGGFTVAKVVAGDAASLVPPGTTFTVSFSYDAGAGPVTGELEVPADGTPVIGPDDLPEGTVVTFEEITLPDVAGVTWGTAAITVDGELTNTLTVGAGATGAVVVTNTASTTPAPTPSPTDPGPGPGPGGELPGTGSDVGPLPGVALALLVAGTLAAAIARRRGRAGG